ncbi:hypothetical protein BH18ACI5_BH18ACI5_27300 [soil metagenome]
MVNGQMPQRVLALLAMAQFLGMTLWFSATATSPRIVAEFSLSESSTAWLTMAVQGRFVVGTLFSAMANLADVYNARRLFAVGCALGAIANPRRHRADVANLRRFSSHDGEHAPRAARRRLGRPAMGVPGARPGTAARSDRNAKTENQLPASGFQLPGMNQRTCVSGIARLAEDEWFRTASCTASWSAASRNDLAAIDSGSPIVIGTPVSPPIRIGS